MRAARRTEPQCALARHPPAFWGSRREDSRPSAPETPRNHAGKDGRVSVARTTAAFGRTLRVEPENRRKSPSDRWDNRWRSTPAESKAFLRDSLLHEKCSTHQD